MLRNILMGIGGFLIFLVVLGLFLTIHIVGAGERGVLVTFGRVNDEIYPEGLQFKMPYIQNIVNVDIKTQKSEYLSNSASRDLQSVTTTVALNYHPNPETVNLLFQEIGLHYENRVIKPAIEEAIKATTAKYTAEELITERTDVRDSLRTELEKRLNKYHILVDDVSIVNFSFSPEFNKAIEEKQTAEQAALKAKWDLETVKVQAQQRIEQAKAEAEALRLQKQELTPELIQLRAIEKWDGHLPSVTGGGALPFINVGQ